MRILFFIFIINILQQQVTATEHQTYFFEKVGDEKQIPYQSIITMVEGNNGFLWLGTQYGLIRYDGYEFKNYHYSVNNSNSVSNNQVYRLAQDKQNRLYLGYKNNGFSVFDTKAHRFIHYNRETKVKPSHNKIYSILPTESGEILIATRLGIDFFDPDKKQLKTIKPTTVKNFSPRTAIIDNYNPNIAWIATNEALWRLDIKKRVFTHILNKDSKSSPLHLHQINSDIIWLTTYTDGVKKINLNTKKMSLLLKDVNLVLSILPFSTNEYWLMAQKKGIVKVNAKGEKIGTLKATPFNDHSIRDNRITSAVKLSSGTIFFGSWTGGLTRYTPNNNLFTSYFLGPKNTSPFNVTNVTEVANNTLLIGTNNGVLVFSVTTGNFLNNKDFFPESSPVLTARTSDFITLNSGTTWIATNKGIYEYNLLDKSLVHHLLPEPFEGSIMNIQIAKNNKTLFLKGTSTLLAYDIATKKAEALSVKGAKEKQLINGSRSHLTIDIDSNLFVHNGSDILMLPAGKKELIKLDISKTGVKTIFSIKKKPNGILVFTDKGIYTAENYQHKLPVLKLSDLSQSSLSYVNTENLQFDDQGRMWSSTKLFDFLNNNAVTFSKKDGVDLGMNWHGSYAKLNNGDLVFGGSKGIQITRPSKFEYVNDFPKIILTNYWYNGRLFEQSYQQQRNLDNISSVRFEFSALDYAEPDLIKYQYKLEGFDTDWQQASADNRTASYTNLPPSSYSLLVKSTNRIGDWGSEITKLATFTILPKYYQTWWFKLIISAFLLAILFKLHTYRLSRQLLFQQKEAQRELALERAELMAELVEKKNKLLADVSHELRTPLTVLKLQVESLQHKLDDDVESSYQALAEKLVDIERLISDIYQLAKSDIGALDLHFTELDFPETLNTWLGEFKLMVESQQLTWRYHNEISTEITINADAERIKQILANLLSNSIKYTDKPGSICLTCLADKNSLYLIIEDSSPSVPEDLQTQIFERLYRMEESRSRATGGAGLGLAICKSLVEAHDGIITAETAHLGGIKITIQLPLKVHEENMS
jgi:signal transduction histidine kinase/ligand-binding sensor domain-containing protein